MTPENITSICGVIAEAHQQGDIVNLTIGTQGEGKYVSLSNAPSHIIEAIQNSGYDIHVEYGTVIITAEEA